MWGDNANHITFNVNILKYYWIFFESEIYLITCLVILPKENGSIWMQSKNNYTSIVKIKMKKEHLLFNVYVQYQTKRKRGYIKKVIL